MSFASVVVSYAVSPWRHRTVWWQFVRREILQRYRGSALGILWAVLSPLLMLFVYTLVFVGIFKARWPGTEDASGVAFGLRLFVGLMVFNLFSEVVGRAPVLVLEQPNLVKKVVFPLELLPYVSVGSALFNFSMGAGILLFGVFFLTPEVHWNIALLPLMVLPLLPMLLGLGWFFSAVGVYVRDTAPVVSLGMGFLMFLSPVFYSLQAMSPEWRFWMELNPLTMVIENIRSAVFLGVAPDWVRWFISLGTGLCVALAGAWVFHRLRDGFADVV